MKNLFLLALVGETASAAPSLNVLDLIRQAGWVVQGVMFILICFSIVSWTIIFWKLYSLRNAAGSNHKFAETFWASGSLESATKAAKAHASAPLTRVFEAGLFEYNQVTALKLDRNEKIELLESNVSRSLEKATVIEAEGLQKHLSFLANSASAAPFIGLFGTVWGIMTSFINIGATGASNLAVVAPGIAEALIATAMGLFAAIPAALFFNFFAGRIRGINSTMQNFSTDFLNTAKRSL